MALRSAKGVPEDCSHSRNAAICAAAAELIARGADVNALRDGDAFTPLAQAAHKAHIGCLRVLLAAGASLDCRPLGVSLVESLQYAPVNSEEVRRILFATASSGIGDHVQ